MILALLISIANALTIPSNEALLPYRAAVGQQLTKLSEMSTPDSRACTNRYDRLWKNGELGVDWYYGYLDSSSGAVADRLMRNEMIVALEKPCTNGLSACGFSEISTGEPFVIAKSTPRGRFVIRFSTSSAHDWNFQNTVGVSRVMFRDRDQSAKSRQTWSAYLDSLTKSKVVIYDGHSRHGMGPGFGPYSIFQMIEGKVWNPNWRRVESALRDNAPEVMMFASCESQRYYLPSLKRIAPRTAVAATRFDESFGAGEETTISLIDSLLVGRCEDEMNQALTPVSDPRDGGMQMSGFDD